MSADSILSASTMFYPKLVSYVSTWMLIPGGKDIGNMQHGIVYIYVLVKYAT
jgi:hypothetical protein